MQRFQKLMANKPAKFIATGGLLYLIDIITTAGLYYFFHMAAAVASGIGFMMGFVVGFTINKNIVFKHSEKSRWGTKTQATMYLLLATFNLTLSSYVAHVAVQAGVRVEVIKTILIATMAVWNYFILNKIIFQARK